MKIILIFFFSIMIIFSCKNESKNVEPESCFEINDSDTINHRLECKWSFLGFKNKSNGNELCKPSSLRNMTISFENDNRLKVISSCNNFEGYFTKLSSNALNIDSLTTTLVYCIDDSVKNWEENYFKSLDKTISYKIEHDVLTIVTSTEFDLIFRFESTNNLSVNDCFNFNTGDVDMELFIKWILIGYVENQEYCKPDNIPEMTIEFNRFTNRFKAYGSCNYIEGDFELIDSQLFKTNNVSSTIVYCLNDTIRNWEEKYYNGLQNVLKYKIEGVKLTLETENNLRFIFKAE